MLICNCTLAGTRACLECPNNAQYLVDKFNTLQYEHGKYFFPKKKKVTEYYDKKGNLIKRTIE